jgi:hypothetical protein
MAGIIQALISETRNQHAVILDEQPKPAPAK